MEILMIFIFVLGYLAIVFEQGLKIDKAASALLTAVLCWTVYILGTPDKEAVGIFLNHQTGEIAQILFFLLGAMVIVELVDAHDGFELVTNRIRTTNKRKLLWQTTLITFFLSAVLDNLTTTIVMISLLRKLSSRREDRMLFAGMIIIAANAGGAWSPMGDVTTTMLWIGHQISALNIIKVLFLPSLVCVAIPLMLMSRSLKGNVEVPEPSRSDGMTSTPFERNIVFAVGIGSLLLVPIFKTLTHLPPFMGMLLGLGLCWVLTEHIHRGKDASEIGSRSAVHALRTIDTPSILFFLGILLSIAALQAPGILTHLAALLDRSVGNLTVISVLIGFLSAIVDNVPLVAATQGMYSLAQYPTDHYLWELIAFCSGTGGSVLIIGSAAGVAAMGMEKLDFMWYLRRISWLALLGYLGGVLVYTLIN